ncbi:MAG: polysaccharide lyase [Nitrososphaera sp.]|nr:polysaccharide lyase [Nitrososphaera sp.]
MRHVGRIVFMLIGLGCCTLVFIQPRNGFAAVLFQETFEDANFASRGWYDITGGVLSSAEHLPGSTKSMECRFLTGQTGCNGRTPGRHLFTESDAVHVSYWIKYSTNWTGSNQSYGMHEFYLLTNKNGAWDGLAFTRLTGYIEQNEGVPVLTIQDGRNIDQARINQDLQQITENRAVAGCNGVYPDGYSAISCYNAGAGTYWNGKQWKTGQAYFQDAAGPYYKSNWHHVEAYFKLNSIQGGKGIGDGIVKYWYDGQLIIDRNNVMLRTGQHPDMKFNQFIIGPYMGAGSPIDQTFWIDNLSVGTAPLLNTTISPPRNLRITP